MSLVTHMLVLKAIIVVIQVEKMNYDLGVIKMMKMENGHIVMCAESVSGFTWIVSLYL